MTSANWKKTAAANLALLAIGVAPVCLLLMGLFAHVRDATPTSSVVGTASVLFPVMLGPLLAGGVVYLTLLSWISGHIKRGRRVVAVALTPVVALGFGVFGSLGMAAQRNVWPALFASLCCYGFLVRIPGSENQV